MLTLFGYSYSKMPKRKYGYYFDNCTKCNIFGLHTKNGLCKRCLIIKSYEEKYESRLFKTDVTKDNKT